MTPTPSIVGDWIHAHEQDHDDVHVFVPASVKLPPSRGRRRLVLKADGTFDDHKPGADDRMAAASGGYEFSGGKLRLRAKGAGAPAEYTAKLAGDGASLELKRVA